MISVLLVCGTFAAALWNSELHTVRFISRTAVIAILLLALRNWGAW
ncbi:hypothetical protein [Streptomyces canus]|nr:hypothetical protein OH824_17810 [Streptomyces canus]